LEARRVKRSDRQAYDDLMWLIDKILDGVEAGDVDLSLPVAIRHDEAADRVWVENERVAS
jgi:hypothetical protein